MTFLVRDWQFPDEHAYGFEGGANLLSSRLDTCQSDFKSKRELNELLTDLKRYFNCKIHAISPAAFVPKTEI